MLDTASSRHLCNRPTAAKIEPINKVAGVSEKTYLRVKHCTKSVRNEEKSVRNNPASQKKEGEEVFRVLEQVFPSSL